MKLRTGRSNFNSTFLEKPNGSKKSKFNYFIPVFVFKFTFVKLSGQGNAVTYRFNHMDELWNFVFFVSKQGRKSKIKTLNFFFFSFFIN